MQPATSAATVFHALSCPTRRVLLDELSTGERNVGDLVAALSVTQSAVSQHLAVLRTAGLVEERAEGRFRVYRLVPGPLSLVDAWLARYRAVMERRLDDLGAVLDQMPDATPHDPPKSPSRKKRGSRAERKTRT